MVRVSNNLVSHYLSVIIADKANLGCARNDLSGTCIEQCQDMARAVILGGSERTIACESREPQTQSGPIISEVILPRRQWVSILIVPDCSDISHSQRELALRAQHMPRSSQSPLSTSPKTAPSQKSTDSRCCSTVGVCLPL